MRLPSSKEYAPSCEGAPVAKISLSAIRANYRRAAHLASPAALICVVKADAYGHGAARVATALFQEGARHFAVARLSEALVLSRLLPRAEILILGHSPPSAAPLLASRRLIQTVGSATYARALSAAASEPVRIHLKLDAGMGRLGLRAEPDAAREAAYVLSLPRLCAEGIVTHLPTADDPSDSASARALRRVRALASAVAPHLPLHALASAGLLRFGSLGMPFVRSGILLYGYPPSPLLSAEGFLPAMQLYAPIVAVRDLRAGDTVGYGSRFIAPSAMRAVTLAIGYADGLPRSLSGGALAVRGQVAPILGRICMDMTVCRAPDGLSLCEGELFPVFGGEGAPLSLLAHAAKTIPYELLSALTARVRRVSVD